MKILELLKVLNMVNKSLFIDLLFLKLVIKPIYFFRYLNMIDGYI